MKVYKMKLVIGKTSNYDKNGKLKNETISPKYDEFELANILEDDNWKKLGACEIECLYCVDYDLESKKSVENLDRKNEINEIINSKKNLSINPKTEIELMREQNDLLIAQLKELKENKPVHVVNYDLSVSEDRLNLESQADRLGINYRSTIGDKKLLEKIQAIEPEFKL